MIPTLFTLIERRASLTTVAARLRDDRLTHYNVSLISWIKWSLVRDMLERGRQIEQKVWGEEGTSDAK